MLQVSNSKFAFIFKTQIRWSAGQKHIFNPASITCITVDTILLYIIFLLLLCSFCVFIMFVSHIL